MGKRKMANLKKSGIRTGLAALFLCVSISSQVQAAAVQDAGITDTPNTEMQPGGADAGIQPGQDGTGMQPGQDGAGTGMQPGQGGMGAGMQTDASGQTVRAEAAIVEVESGFVDAKGSFWKMKSGSGFLIANKENATYIVTNSSSVSNTPGKIKKYCKKHKIDTENMQLQNSIRVVITGDVTAAAEVVIKSAEKDYCVLSAANIASQKESLKLGSGAGVAVNEMVCAYGFEKQTGKEETPIEYSPADVRAIQGVVTQTEVYQEGGGYLAHSAPVLQGMEGGPLLDADGYVIGLNCKKPAEDDTGIAYALPIDEISAVLDNFAIYYGSRAIDEAGVQMESVYQQCAAVLEENGYKKESMEALELAMETAAGVMALEEPKAQELQTASQMLYEALGTLEPKTEKITIAVMVMGVCDIVLFLCMLVLAVKNAQEKKWMELERMHGASQQAAQGRNSQMQQPRAAGYSGSGMQGQPSPQAMYHGGRPGQQAAQRADSFRQPVTPPAGRRLRLLRQKTGQTAVLNKNQFIIGKSQTMADFSIPDNQTISRKHAMLFEDNGGWYVDDLNSLNGTSVNGRKIVPGQPVRLKSGDEISLSDETFLVQE